MRNTEKPDKPKLVNLTDEINKRSIEQYKLVGDQWASHCYKCKSFVHSKLNSTCEKCEWLICDCKACGCQHPKYRKYYPKDKSSD